MVRFTSQHFTNFLVRFGDSPNALCSMHSPQNVCEDEQLDDSVDHGYFSVLNLHHFRSRVDREEPDYQTGEPREDSHVRSGVWLAVMQIERARSSGKKRKAF